MRTHRGPRVDATILGAASLLALAMGNGNGNGFGVSTERFELQAPSSVATGNPVATDPTAADLVGVWLSADRTVRLELKQTGRYDRSIVGRDAVTTGSYRVDAATLDLRDDSGLHTIVPIMTDTLDMAGHPLYRA